MPVSDIVKRRIAQRHKLYIKICRSCGVRNPSSAVKCRKCRGKNLRWKNRDIGSR